MPWKCFLNCVRSQAEDVRQLDYQHSMLQDVPPEVFAYERTLEELYLDSNRIRDLPRPLFHCHGLRILSMSDNEVQSLPPAIASLINLQHLDLSRNGIVNQLEKLPEGFTQLLSLEELYLNDTCLDFLPANFGRLTKLRILELRENNLNTLPKSIARLSSLERMDIGQNEFSDLFIGNLKKLTHFDASTNNINWVAPEIGSCSSLTDLTLSCNEIPEIPDSIGNLKMLVTLKLDDNQLTSLPPSIGKLSNLEELILSQNDFETLSPCIGLLRKLNILNADDNMLEELPPGNMNEMKSDVKCNSRQLEKSMDRPHIRFATDADSEVTGHLVRAPTPYPKELRAMAKHARSYQQQHTRRISRESESEVPLLGEMVSPGPKGVLIKEAKVKKPSTVPLAQQAGLKRNKENDEENVGQTVDTPSKLESVEPSADESTPVLASGSGPVIREAKYIRQVTSTGDEREKFFSQKEDIALSPSTIDFIDAASPRHSIASEPPPYHIAAVYSKQAAYFNVRTSSPAASISSQIPASPDVPQLELSSTELKSSDEKDCVTSAAQSPMQPNTTVKEENNKTFADKRKEFFGSSWQAKSESNLPVNENEEKSVVEKILDKPNDENKENIMASFNDKSANDVTEIKSLDAQIPIPDLIKETKESIQSYSGYSKTVNSTNDSVNTTESLASVTAPTVTSSLLSTNILNSSTLTNNVSPLDTSKDHGNESDGQAMSPPVVEPLKEPPLSPKCRIPVRLSEPLSLKSDNSALTTPSTFTQDKPVVDDSIFAPTPQRPGCGSPTPITPSIPKPLTSPKSPTSVSRAGSRIPSLLPSVIHGVGKSEVKSPLRNNSPSPVPDKLPTESKSINSSLVSSNSKPLATNNWSSTGSDAESLSDSVSPTRIPLPGFYSHSPMAYQSSKRGSISSQSSSSSRPGSIAPLNTSLDSSPSPISKEPGYNYINKPRFTSTDYNLNISSRIPTAASSPLSQHTNSLSGFPSNYESSSPHTNSRSNVSNEHSPVSKIPTLATSPVSPTRMGSPLQNVSTNSSDGSPVKSSLESPGRQTKTWMFGPHKNATVFPVVIKKNAGLGFSITGGLGSSSPVEKRENEGIFVTKVHPNGPASNCLVPGDKILEVDGTDFTKLGHDQAVGILKQTGNVVNMMISRQQ
ncbi:hypothetical protein C0J52_00772 [Blattella germanica]|nr:hypothetical protein C0J52_00772 [Blattella germanica]